MASSAESLMIHVDSGKGEELPVLRTLGGRHFCALTVIACVQTCFRGCTPPLPLLTWHGAYSKPSTAKR